MKLKKKIKWLMPTRVEEHIWHTKHQDSEKWTKAERSYRTKHAIEFEKTKVIVKFDQ